VEKSKAESKQQWLDRKEFDKQIRKVEANTEKTEAEIHALEKRIETMDALLASPEGSKEADADFYIRYNEIKKQLVTLMDQWEQLSMEAEELKEKRKEMEG